jgi:hypothetical protein
VIVALIALAVIAIAGFAKYAIWIDKKASAEPSPGVPAAGEESAPKLSALMHESIDGWHGDDTADAEFEAVIADTIPVEAQEKAFYVRVRGTSFRNDDRTLRTRIIGECSTFDPILLVPKPENPFDINAIAVCRRETNEQLGYLDSRLAGEITRDEAKHGPHWVAFFRRKTHHPESGRTAGAVIRGAPRGRLIGFVRGTRNCSAQGWFSLGRT